MKTHIRKFENFHILLWLLKDLCWVTFSKSLGVIMIPPILGLAIYITFINRKIKSELAHNLAVCFWICANSTWMVGEFFYEDSFRSAATAFFLAGLIVMLLYYIPFVYRNSISKSQKEID